MKWLKHTIFIIVLYGDGGFSIGILTTLNITIHHIENQNVGKYIMVKFYTYKIL